MGIRLRREMPSRGVRSYTWVGIDLLDKVTSANSGSLHNQGDVKGHSSSEECSLCGQRGVGPQEQAAQVPHKAGNVDEDYRERFFFVLYLNYMCLFLYNPRKS